MIRSRRGEGKSVDRLRVNKDEKGQLVKVTSDLIGNKFDDSKRFFAGNRFRSGVQSGLAQQKMEFATPATPSDSADRQSTGKNNVAIAAFSANMSYDNQE